MKDIYFAVDFVVGNSNKLQNWVWKEKSVEPSMYSHLGNNVGYTRLGYDNIPHKKPSSASFPK